MSLTQQQINEAGEAFNEAMSSGIISVELRGRLVADLRNPSAGNAELLAAARKIRQSTWSGYQAAVDAYIAMLSGGLQPPAPAQPQTPAPSQPPTGNYPIGKQGIPIRPLTNAEQRIAIDAISNFGYQDIATKVESYFARGFYPIGDASIVDRVKEVIGNASPEGNKVLWQYLSAIDQRDFTTDKPLAPNDPRIVPVGGLSPVASQAPSGAPVVGGQFLRMVNPETGFEIQIFPSWNDDGLRVCWNYGEEKGPPYGTYSNPKLPQLFFGMERDGAIFFGGAPPLQDANGNWYNEPDAKGWRNARGPYDKGGKNLVIYPNGFLSGGNRGKSVDIACMVDGRTIRIAASSGTANPQFQNGLEITADGVKVGKPL